LSLAGNLTDSPSFDTIDTWEDIFSTSKLLRIPLLDAKDLESKHKRDSNNTKHGEIWPRNKFTIYTMKLLDIQAAIGTAILLLSSPCDARHSHKLQHLDVFAKNHVHKRIHASPRVEGIESGLEKRGSCAFPDDAGLVAVAPGGKNKGWAMAPDVSCGPGHYCPYACPPGQVSAQWDPSATAYVYPQSMVSSTVQIRESDTNCSRMAVFIVISMVRFISHSPTNRTV
jgi:hypothetical protein